MSNNRIYLRCMGCGDTLYLGGSNLGGYFFINHHKETLDERLNAFYRKHNYCVNEKVECVPYDEKAFPLPENMDECDGAFDIVYENTVGTGREDPLETNSTGEKV